MPARIRRKSLSAIAREGFLDRRSKRCFWLLLSPQTKVACAGARNYPRRRQILRLRRCAATPHPPPSGAPVSLRVGRFADLTRHRRVIQRREPLKGKADGGVSFNTATHQGGRLTEVCHSTPRTHQGEGLRVRHSHRGPLKGKAWHLRAGVQRKFTVFLQNLKVELRKASML